MRARVVSVGVCLLAIAVTVTGFFALAEHAEAQPVEAADCRAAVPLVLEQSGLLMASGDHLLTRDGYGFFSADIDSIAVRGAGFDPAVAATTEAIARSLADFYDTTDVDVITDLDEQTSEPARVVIIDGDIAVPGHPTVFNVGGVPTLYLHWTSGATEIVELLDVPEFASFAASATSDTCASSETAVAAVPGVTPEPDDILAYVDEEPDTASPASGRTPVSPLADTSSPELPPLPVAAAAIVVAAGGVVLHQRDKIWGDRFAPRPQPAEALIHKSKPVYPTADLPPAHPRVIFLDEDEAQRRANRTTRSHHSLSARSTCMPRRSSRHSPGWSKRLRPSPRDRSWRVTSSPVWSTPSGLATRRAAATVLLPRWWCPNSTPSGCVSATTPPRHCSPRSPNM